MRCPPILAVLGLSICVRAVLRVDDPGSMRSLLQDPRHIQVLKTSVRRVKTPASRISLAQARYSRSVHARQAGGANSSAPLSANITDILYGYEYVIDAQVGTPLQNVSLILDTGSPESWVNPVCDAMSHQAVCFAAGRYNASDSTTAQNLSAIYSITYGSGSVEGWYFRDSFAVAGKPASAVQFGVATYSYNLDAGVLGLGYDSVVLDELMGQGVVGSKDFSVSMGSSSSAHGQAVFGGVDTAKFSGQLQAIPMIDSDNFFSQILRYQVNLTYMGVTSKGSCESKAATDTDFWGPAVVDTGSTISHLPFDVVNKTAAMIPGTRYDPYLQLWKVSCHYADSADTVDFGFGNVTVNIPIREFVWRNIPAGGQCFLGMVGDADSIGVSVLGDSFLRALVALYQPDKKTLHLAPFSDCGTDVWPTQDDIGGLSGKCKRPEWDSCASRPVPVPLAVSSTSWSSLSWARATPTDIVPLPSETGRFSTLLPLADPLEEATGGIGTRGRESSTRPSIVVEPFPTDLPVATLAPVSLPSNSAGSAVAGTAVAGTAVAGTAVAGTAVPTEGGSGETTTSPAYTVTPTKASLSSVTTNAGCHKTSLCVLALTTEKDSGVTANEECLTYSTCTGAAASEPTYSSTGWDDTIVIDPATSPIHSYATTDTPTKGSSSDCLATVYVMVTIDGGEAGCRGSSLCTAAAGK